MIEVVEKYEENGVHYRRLLITRDDLDDYQDPDTHDWVDRVVDVDYHPEDDTWTVLVPDD